MTCLLNTENFDEDFLEKIKETERKIFSSVNKKRDNNLSVCGRVLLGYMLKKIYNIDHFTYRYGENGKPFLENEGIFFSISHSDKYVLCCVSDENVGCDIEKVKEYNPKIAKRFFTEKESRAIECSNCKERTFIRIWTLKESILKKDGTGIGGGLDSYCFADNVCEENFISYGCRFSCHSCDGYEISVCTENTKEEIIILSEEELIKYMNDLNLKNT